MQDKAAGGPEYRSYTTASFARWARFYDLFVALFGVRGVRRAAVEIGDLQPGDRVLDVCTGTGDVALEFAKHCLCDRHRMGPRPSLPLPVPAPERLG